FQKKVKPDLQKESLQASWVELHYGILIGLPKQIHKAFETKTDLILRKMILREKKEVKSILRKN
uniref:Uncharacterized protein n=1 Tax=Piliocolobus tephrosceles TaxID=591936 RepID=A0A8C9HZP5_9PRIM